ncbi:MAG: GLUG motif-containing protein [Rikenellaceae bacterium]
MNIIRNFWVLFIVSLTAVAFVGCNDDDEEETRYISTAAQLVQLSEDVNDADDTGYAYSYINVVLTADIDMAGVEWTPIGHNQIQYYSATFNGNGHTIKNLTIDAADQPYKGLIGFLYEGEIKNLTLENPQLACGERVGAICAKMVYGSSITNCKVVGGSIKGTSYVGGVVGDASWSTITNCYNEGTTVEALLAAGYNIGGVAGSSTSSSVEGCYNTGTVSGLGSYMGGVVGYTYLSSILGSYNTGDVSSSGDYIGGVTGSSSSYIVACYSKADVSGGDFVGGVVGSVGSQYTDLNSYITACYSDGTITGTGAQVAGVAGKTDLLTTTLLNCYFTDSAVEGVYEYDSDMSTYNPDSTAGEAELTDNLTAKFTLMNIAIDGFTYEGSSVKIPYEYYQTNGELLLRDA